jgi:anti-sigma-K factor RskA
MPAEHQLSESIAAYVLGALDPAEAETLRAHLARSAVCSDELRTFKRVIAALPEAVPQHAAPARLRRRVIAAVRRDPSGHAGRRRVRRAFAPAPARWGLALAAGLAALAVTGVELLGGRDGDVRVYPAVVSGPSGTAQLTVSEGRAELTVSRLPQPVAGRIYEVWLQRGHQPPQPTRALFGVTRDGSGDVVVPGQLRGVTSMIVTQEPDGGSTVPTLPAVISADVT